MKDNITEFDNTKLLKLIDEWINSEGKENTYQNVVLELLNGNSYLFVQTHGEQVKETKNFVSDKNTKLTLGLYEIRGKNYFGAFTDLDLLEKWLKVTSSYARVPSKALLEMVENTNIDGVVINSSFRNMFVVFRTRSK